MPPKIQLASLCLALATVTVQAEAAKGLEIALISETTTVVPGEPFTVGLHIEHDAGFHTYWKNPGIVGMATAIDWTLPAGFTASEIRWPYPELTKMAQHPCHGYERDVTLLVTITPPKEIASRTVSLQAATRWMCCADQCSPGAQTLTLDLKVSDSPTPDPAAAKVIAQAQQEIPQSSKAWSGAVLSGPNEPVVRIQINTPHDADLSEAYLFSCDGQISSDKKQTFTRRADGSWLLTTERSAFSPKNPKQLSAVLKVGTHHILIHPKYSP
ncbi:hypothetical protein JO972_11225 [Verrucomicrobiaceae bacterium 5K15]|uniref:Thiol:disulfide interchange protein DsbD N-terminal domain-containing protein n=1 Tax=Oceaniferula flava TaxID=2800421 RepID=A0AAE2SDQ6_9BACT|nr:protein-disulfide reductase DsbD domain-containing protein [Oceaniferula flavus]MBK1855532.1 hypothetical protein [Oceaniferula flavus]MBM1136838.1 hypothetical protein [Oceaniferula flavus]